MKSGFLKKLKTLALSIVPAALGIMMLISNSSKAVSAVETENKFYRMVHTENALSIEFDANIKNYKNIRKADLAEFKNDLVEAAKDIVFTQISEQFAEDLPSKKVKSKRIDVSSLEDLLYVFEGNIKENGEVSKFLVANLLADEDKTFEDTASYFISQFAQKLCVENELKYSKQSHELLNSFTESFNTLISPAYEVGEAPSTVSFFAGVETRIENGPINLDLRQMTRVFQAISIASETTPIDAGKFLTDIFYTVDGATPVKETIVNTVIGASTTDIVDFLTTVDSQEVVDTFNAVNFAHEDLVAVIDKIGSEKIIEVANIVGVEDFQNIFKAIDNFDFEDAKDKVVDGLTFKAIIKLVKELKINDKLVLKDLKPQSDGIKALIRTLPRPSELATWADEDMHLDWDIDVTTSLGYVSFNFEVGFFGDCSYIRRAANIIDEVFDVSYDDGQLNIAVNGKSFIMNIFEYVFEGDLFSDKLKIELYNLLFSSVGEISDYFFGLTVYDVVDKLKNINYVTALDTMLSADVLNDLLSVSVFTDNRLQKMYDGFMKLVNKAATIEFSDITDFVNKYVDISKYNLTSKLENLYNKVLRVVKRVSAHNISYEHLTQLLEPGQVEYTNDKFYSKIEKLADYDSQFEKLHVYLTKFLDKIPERLRDNKLLDYYTGNGNFSLVGEVNLEVNLPRLLNLIPGRLGEYADKAYDLVKDVIPTTIKFDFEANIPNFYSLELLDIEGNPVKKVGLAEGMELETFLSDTDQDLSYIRDSYATFDGNDYTSILLMPGKDTTVYALGLDITISEDITETYDPEETYDITVTAANGCTYVWYYNADAASFAEATKLDNTTATVTVSDVADSGYYCCKVTSPQGITKETKWVNVVISPVQVEMPTVSTTEFTFENGEITLPVTLGADEDLFEMSGTTGTNAGDYQAVASLKDSNNYTWSDGTVADLKFNWTINKLKVTKPTAGTDLTFTGSAQTYTLDDTTDNSWYTVTGDTGTNAGSYKVTVALNDKLNTTWTDGNTADLTIDWKINKLKVAMPTAGTDLTYSGSAQTYTLGNTTDSSWYTVTGDTGTNAGNYQAIATLKDSVNTTWTDGTVADVKISWNMKKQAVTAPTASTVEFTYDGNAKSLGLTTSSLYKIEGDSQTNAGSYTATITLLDTNNYEWTSESKTSISWKINKAGVTKPTLDTSSTYTYNGADQTVVLLNLDDNTLYTISGNKAKNAGDYTVTITIKDKNNYVWTGTDNANDVTYSWSIAKKSVIEPTIGSGFTFDGTAKTVEFTNTTDSALYNISGTTQTNAGTYAAKVTLKDAANYVWATAGHSNELSYDWTIDVLTISVPSVTGTYTYNTQTQTAAIVTNPWYTITGEFEAINAGEHHATVTLNDPVNTKWNDDTTAAKDLLWTIAKASVTLGEFTFGETTFICDGTEHEVVLNGSYNANLVMLTATGYKASGIGNYHAVFTFSLVDSSNYEFASGTKTVYETDWVINAAPVPPVDDKLDSGIIVAIILVSILLLIILGIIFFLLFFKKKEKKNDSNGNNNNGGEKKNEQVAEKKEDAKVEEKETPVSEAKAAEEASAPTEAPKASKASKGKAAAPAKKAEKTFPTGSKSGVVKPFIKSADPELLKKKKPVASDIVEKR